MSYIDGGDRPYRAPAPDERDLTHDELEFNPAIEPKSAKAWLNLLRESEKAFEDYNVHCDRINQRYANLGRLSDMARDKQFQLFWANIEVLKPAIYAKAPLPVVVPKFKDRRPVYTNASEVLERCCHGAFDLGTINEIMLQVRDDLALLSRGVVWCRYEPKQGNSFYAHERICYDFKDRRDFLHSLSRNWSEVWWVAAASYMTKAEAHDRFARYSGDCYEDAEYSVDRDNEEIGGADNRERAKFWEVWNKRERRVVWVAEGCEDILDEDDPELDLQYFFPCPKPAYGCLQRGSLVPVPDVLQYKDQLDEIDMLTGRIHACSNAIAVKGFYPGGGGEIADAVQAALNINSSGQVLVPISNWAAFGGSKEIIIWMPIADIVQAVQGMVELRQQVIQDVYQIMGLSDIMRGATDPKETLGAQELKTEYGSSRVRDKQYELERLSKELVCITADIICAKFDDVTIIEMSQTDLPTQDIQQVEVQRLQQLLMQNQMQAQQAAQLPPPQPPDPTQSQSPAAIAGAGVDTTQAQLMQAMQQPTMEQVLAFLRDRRARAFVLDIETDSTIFADENAEKQARNEFLGMLGNLLPQLIQMSTTMPWSVKLSGAILQFAVAPYRAGRSLDSAIDDFIDQAEQQAGQAQPEDPATMANKTQLQIEQLKQSRQAQQDQATNQLKAVELQMKDQHERMKIQSNENIKMLELNAKRGDEAAKERQTNLKAMAEREAHQMDMAGKFADLQINQQKAQMTQQHMQQREQDRRNMSFQRAAQPPRHPGAL